MRPSPIDLTREADLDPGRYAVTAQGVAGSDGSELATLQARIRIYVPEGASIEVEVLEGEEVVVEIVFRQADVDATPVVFADPVFEAAIREQLERPSGDVTRADMATLTTLDVTQGQIETQSLEGIQHATNLRSLFIGGTAVEDLATLADLESLEMLYAWKWGSDARIVDVSPLAPLTQLRSLSVYEQNRADHDLNTIDDISAVADMRELRYFSVRNNLVADLTPLTNLTQLVTLDLTDSPIRDLRPLAGLVNLEVLEVCCAPEPDSGGITTVAALENLESLRVLWIHENFISDLTPIADLPDLEFVAMGLNCLTFEPQDASTGIVAAWRSAGVEVRELSDQ